MAMSRRRTQPQARAPLAEALDMLDAQRRDERVRREKETLELAIARPRLDASRDEARIDLYAALREHPKALDRAKHLSKPWAFNRPLTRSDSPTPFYRLAHELAHSVPRREADFCEHYV